MTLFRAEFTADFSDGLKKLDRVRRNEANWRKRFLKGWAEGGVEMMQDAVDDQLTYGADTGAWEVTGNLWKSLGFWKLSAKEVELGTRGLIYAHVHEFGAEGANAITVKTAPWLVFYVFDIKYLKKKVEIPARPYIRPVFYDNDMRFHIPERVIAEMRHIWHK